MLLSSNDSSKAGPRGLRRATHDAGTFRATISGFETVVYVTH